MMTVMTERDELLQKRISGSSGEASFESFSGYTFILIAWSYLSPKVSTFQLAFRVPHEVGFSQ